MSKWLALAKVHFQQKHTEATPKTPKTPLLGVMGVASVRVFEKKDRSANNSLIPTTTAAALDMADADRWCWPKGTAMNGAEIANFKVRLARFTAKGLTFNIGEALADRLMIRDRDSDDRRSCLECINLAGFGPWHCRNWRQAGVTMKAQDAALPAGLMILLQRCDAFSTGAT